MKKAVIKALVAAVCFWGHAAAELKFKSHVVYEEKAGGWGQTSVLDFNGDGKLDFTAGRAFGNPIWWWENTGDMAVWKKHLIDDNVKGNCVGGDATDVDGDGITDFVSSGWWYKGSPENTTGTPKKNPFNGGSAITCHDVMVVDLDGDSLQDVVNHTITWWKAPPPDQMTEKWPSVRVTKSGYHGGITPKGWGDIDGDGDNDLVGIGNWFKNVNGDGQEWEKKQYATWSSKNENRIWVADYDGDEDLDIAVAEGDHGDGLAAWFKNVDGKGEKWETMELPLDGLSGDLHSVGGHDFDLDGDNDIFVGQNKKKVNEWVIFENMDGKGTFEKRIVYEGWGAHETVYGDFDNDGDMDIMSKCWCGDMKIVVLENLADPVVTVTPSVPQAVKNQLSFSARITGSGRDARLQISSKAQGPNTLELFDLQGQKISSYKNKGDATNLISLRGLNEGMYIVRLSAQKGAIAEKIVYQR